MGSSSQHFYNFIKLWAKLDKVSGFQINKKRSFAPNRLRQTDRRIKDYDGDNKWLAEVGEIFTTWPTSEDLRNLGQLNCFDG